MTNDEWSDGGFRDLFPLPGEYCGLGTRLILNSMRRKQEALARYEDNPCLQTQREFLAAVDHLNHIKENV